MTSFTCVTDFNSITTSIGIQFGAAGITDASDSSFPNPAGGGQDRTSRTQIQPELRSETDLWTVEM